jgi:hypothetical protein
MVQFTQFYCEAIQPLMAVFISAHQSNLFKKPWG